MQLQIRGELADAERRKGYADGAMGARRQGCATVTGLGEVASPALDDRNSREGDGRRRGVGGRNELGRTRSLHLLRAERGQRPIRRQHNATANLEAELERSVRSQRSGEGNGASGSVGSHGRRNFTDHDVVNASGRGGEIYIRRLSYQPSVRGVVVAGDRRRG